MQRELRLTISDRALLASLLAALAACDNPVASPAPPSEPAQSERAASMPAHLAKVATRRNRSRTYDVVPYGYNYTDTYIDSFEVNGAGGGNLSVSTPTAGGGKSACCMALYSHTPVGSEFTIKWTRNGLRWCEQTVRLTAPVPPEALYFEVHFYQDGHIEVEATQAPSAPRLKLQSISYGRRHQTNNVNNDEKFSSCKDGYD